jgi:hypothetical protein
MDQAVPDCLVRSYHSIIESLILPDQNDCHVLAAAITGCCDAIITTNLKHFPKDYISKFDIEVQGPDEFIYNQFDLDQSEVILSAHRCRSRLKRPPINPDDYIRTLERVGLTLTASELRKYRGVI